MADGSTKPIDQIQVGDQILSRDPDTGQDAVKTVTATISHPADTLVTITVVDPTTHETSKITCTPEHPIYVQGSGWTDAGDLVKGDALVSRTGQAVLVAGIQLQSDESGKHPFTVYNLTVEDDHTYFAGNLGGGLWVHNTCQPGYLNGTGGRLGNQATRGLNDNLATQLEDQGWQITNGGGRGPEEYIPGPNGGTAGSAYPDITAQMTDSQGNVSTLRINTADTDSSGNFTARELFNAGKIQAAFPGDIFWMIPKL